MKTIKELEKEIEETTPYMRRHLGYEYKEILEAKLQILQEVLKLIEVRIEKLKNGMPKCTFDNNARRLKIAYLIKELEELKQKIEGEK